MENCKNKILFFSGEPALVLPEHPRSRSSGSAPEDINYHTNKMASTPRAEQFEDRLKTIINSVLSKDESSCVTQTKDVKPPVSLSTSGGVGNLPPHAQSSQKPMFSPVKKELPTHLPLPPSGMKKCQFETTYLVFFYGLNMI